MSDDRLGRIEQLLADLIEMVGKSNANAQKTQKELVEIKCDLKEVKAFTAEIVSKLRVLERKQDKMGTRLDNVEVEVTCHRRKYGRWRRTSPRETLIDR